MGLLITSVQCRRTCSPKPQNTFIMPICCTKANFAEIYQLVQVLVHEKLLTVMLLPKPMD